MSAKLQPSEDEGIPLLHIICFLKDAYKTIVITGVVFLVAAATYLAITPNRYEASAQIAMAQVGVANNNNNLNILGVNIEEPSLLIARLAQPTSFPPQVLDICKIDGVGNSGFTIANSIKLIPLKGVSSVVELKVLGGTPQDAQICAQTIFEYIKMTQAQIIAPYIAEAVAKLRDNEDRLAKAKDIVAKADNSGAAIGAAYLSTRDEIRFLLDEITSLKNVVASNQSRVTRLINPIYASDIAVAPKRQLVLAQGILCGLFLGLLIALYRRVIAKLKNEAGGGVN